MAVKTTTGYSFPTIPTKYDSTDKTFFGAIRKLFDTLLGGRRRKMGRYGNRDHGREQNPVRIQADSLNTMEVTLHVRN